ncbi:hypothetical protein V8J88_23910 [Massilia sp. W12]|uniref:hypothetical protein n=1 Tax=Massilia sp. W12 TaxID=3126507 RepID=UPI0030CE1E2C
MGLVNINVGNEGSVVVNAYASPAVGGSEHAPLRVHVEDGKTVSRVLMEDYYKKGKLVGQAGDAYPGDPDLKKGIKKI